MNAIILAAGKSSRMYASGAKIHKALLPIMGIPNIERTILMLHDHNISEIIIAVPPYNHDFDYLQTKYSCIIENIPAEGNNTLYAMNYLLHYIQDTFVIEGDVVCAQNIFHLTSSSFYYVMKYESPESDAWHPILNEHNEIESFEIKCKDTPALFGVSVWTGRTSSILKKHIQSISTNENLSNPHVFWDDFITPILPEIRIKTIEIQQIEALEMNTYDEYMRAQINCQNYLNTCQLYFERMQVVHRIADKELSICYSSDHICAAKWHKRLLDYYKENTTSLCIEKIFDINEKPFVIKDLTGVEYGYFSIAEEADYILLRRLFIDDLYRLNGLGKKIVQFTLTYSRLKSKELRVNVYDINAELFYRKLGFLEYYTCFHQI